MEQTINNITTFLTLLEQKIQSLKTLALNIENDFILLKQDVNELIDNYQEEED